MISYNLFVLYAIIHFQPWPFDFKNVNINIFRKKFVFRTHLVWNFIVIFSVNIILDAERKLMLFRTVLNTRTTPRIV